MKKALKKLGIEKDYLIKKYMLSGLFTIIVIGFLLTIMLSKKVETSLYLGFAFFIIRPLLCWLFYPFSCFVWDSVTMKLFKDYTIIVPIIGLLFWKLVKFIITYGLSPLIGAVGIIYLTIRNK